MNGLPKPPQLPGPVFTPNGGIRGQMPGMPYQTNPVADGVLALGQVLSGIGARKQMQKQQAEQELQKGLQLRSQGLPVDETKLGKLAKTAGYDKYFDFNNPTATMGSVENAGAPMPGQQMPQAGQGAPPPPPMQLSGVPGIPQPPMQMPGMPQGPPPSAQDLPTHSQPRATFQMPASANAQQQMGYGGKGGVNPQSQGVQMFAKMGEQMDTQRGMNQNMAMGAYQQKMLAMNVSLAAMGVGPNGQAVSPEIQQKAQQMGVRMGLLQKFEADDMGEIFAAAKRMGASDEQISQYASYWVQGKSGYEKHMNVVNDMAKSLMSEGGVSPERAFSSAFSMAAGKGLPEGVLPRFNVKTMQTLLKSTMEVQAAYPNAPREVMAAVTPYLLTGRTQEAMNILGKYPTAASLKEGRDAKDDTRKDAQLGLDKQRLKISEGQLSLGWANNKLGQAQLTEQKNQNSIGNSMRALAFNLDAIRVGGTKPTDQQLTGIYNLMANTFPGMFKVLPRQDSWGPGNEPPQLAPFGAASTEQEKLPAVDSTWGKWLMEDFAPAFLEATRFGESKGIGKEEMPLNPLVY